MNNRTKTTIYFLMLILPSICAGLYWAKNGSPDRTTVYILVYYVVVISIIRNVSVGVSVIDFSFNVKKKIERWKKIWTAHN